MPGFFYFLPQPKDRVVADGRLLTGALADAGLTDVLADVAAVPKDCVVAEVRTGPGAGGVPGCILTPVPVHRELPGKLGYDADSQVWQKYGTHGTYLGYSRDALPRPVDLERTATIPGWEIRDAYSDGWSIPVARSVVNRRGNFPFAIRWAADGKPFCGVSGRYQGFWQDSARLWDLVAQQAQPARGGLAIIGEGLTDDDDQFVIDMVHRALQINYRVGPVELAAYDTFRPGWLTQVTASLMANAIVDMHAKRAWEDAQKKTAIRSAAAGVSSTPGDPDDCPVTAPAAAN
jgi:hypothetical protein